MTKKTNVDFKNTEIAFKHLNTSELLKAWTLFRAINIRPLVSVGPPIISWALKARLPVKCLLRTTVFRHFCGGETLEECGKTMDQLHKGGVYSILDYGVEGEKTEAGFDAARDEVLRVVEATKANPLVPFCVFKLTALARFELLETVSKDGADGLGSDLAAEWARVKSRVEGICDAAVSAGKLVMIDAEETWIQKAIDQLSLSVMRKHNTKSAKIYTTIQMYRKDGLANVEALLNLGHKEKWHPGIKLVRGAYMEKERARAKDKCYPSPIHDSKEATDKAYDSALKLILAKESGASLCAGTHNFESTAFVTSLMETHHIPKNSSSVWFAQLLGMSDDLTFNAANAGYNAAKYVPYGPIAAVLPYLFRRAEENTSIAGQSSRELSLIERELLRRKSL